MVDTVVNCNNIKFYLDTSGSTHVIYLATNLQTFQLIYTDNQHRDKHRMNRISARIQQGRIFDLNTLCAAFAGKITWHPMSYRQTLAVIADLPQTNENAILQTPGVILTTIAV